MNTTADNVILEAHKEALKQAQEAQEKNPTVERYNEIKFLETKVNQYTKRADPALRGTVSEQP